MYLAPGSALCTGLALCTGQACEVSLTPDHVPLPTPLLNDPLLVYTDPVMGRWVERYIGGTHRVFSGVKNCPKKVS